MTNDGFSMKEVVIEIKKELTAFRTKYDSDQDDLSEKFAARDREIAKRPTFAQMTGLIGAAGVVVSVVVGVIT